MPFSRPILDYPINRLLLRVGLYYQCFLIDLPPVRGKAEREALQGYLARILRLEEAIAQGLIRRYHFRWNERGQIRALHLVPTPAVRRTPGIRQLKNLLLRQRV